MSHMPTSIQAPFPAIDGSISVRGYGAVGDGVADDTDAIRATIAAVAAVDGGEVVFPPGTYRTTTTLLIDSSDIRLRGDDAELFFDPDVPLVGGTNDRAIYIHSNDVDGYTNARDISGAIAVGASSFTVVSSSDATDLAAGDWLIVQEFDNGATPAGEICIFDWVQVRSVAGTTVNVLAPFRTAFPGTHDTVRFIKILNVVQGVSVRDMRISTTDAVHALPHIVIGIAREVSLENVTSTSARGNAVATYRSADVSMRHCHQRSNFAQPTEFAATVGLSIIDCTFGTYDSQSTGAQLVIDYGTAFFYVAGNRIGPSGNIGCMILYGCHDGAFVGNSFDYVRDVNIGDTLGLLVQGCQRVVVAHNALCGGAGAAAQGITLVDATSGFDASFLSSGNAVIANIVAGFAVPYATPGAYDSYLYESLGGITLSKNVTVAGTLGAIGAVHLSNTAQIDSNTTVGVADTGALLQVNAAAGNLCLQVTGATNGLNDGVVKVQSQKTGWGTVTGKLQTTAGGSGAVDNLTISTDSGYLALVTGSGATALKLAHAGAATFSSSVQITGATGPVWSSNAGTPESAVVGSLGDLCSDTTNGELYVKKSGSATNTGWKLVTHA